MKNTRLEKYGRISSLLSGRGRARVLAILEALAIQGNLTVWELTKTVIKNREHFALGEPSYRQTQSEYGTFRKAVMKFLKFEYVAEQGTVRHSTHREGKLLQYGLTLKGLMVTMVVSEKARQNWQAWARNVLREEVLPQEMKRILSKLIEYGASQSLFLKFFVDPNEKLVTTMYNMDTVNAKTFLDVCVEKMILTFEEGRFNPLKNLSPRDKVILARVYQDPAIRRMREGFLDFLKQEYSERIQKIEQLQKTIPT
jgi:hypothetical protein